MSSLTAASLNDVKRMWFSDNDRRALDLHAGDVVVVEGGVGGFGRAAFVDRDLDECGFQNSINRLRPSGRADGRFLTYALISLRATGWIRAYCNIVSMPHLTADKLAALKVALPTVEAQRAIADYLDRETARIDDLIAEQASLIRLARERFEGLVESALQSEGKRTPLKRHMWTASGFAFPSEGFSADADNVRLLRGVNVTPGGVSWADVVYWPRDDAAGLGSFRLEQGDVVLGLDRPIIAAGIRVARITADDEGALLLQRVLRLRGRGLDNGYLFWALRSTRFSDYLAPIFTGVSVPHLSPGQVGDYPINVPDLDRQREIAGELDRSASRTAALTEECQVLITLLKERRAALITVAVTGQIDLNVA